MMPKESGELHEKVRGSRMTTSLAKVGLIPRTDVITKKYI